MARKDGRRGSWGFVFPWGRIARWLATLVVLALLLVVASVTLIRAYPQLFFALAERMPREPITQIPPDAAEDEKFFKYGSIGNEAGQGFPFKIWSVLPKACSGLIDKAGYAKFPHPASRFALTGVFVAKNPAGDVRVAATGASQSGVMRVPAIEAALKANWSAGAIDGVKISADGLMSDIHGTSDYRANLIKVMAQRAVTAAG